jgi:hypothetical protein
VVRYRGTQPRASARRRLGARCLTSLRSMRDTTRYCAGPLINPRTPPPPQRGLGCFGFIRIIRRYFLLEALCLILFADIPANGPAEEPSLSKGIFAAWRPPIFLTLFHGVWHGITTDTLVSRQANVRSKAPAANRPPSHIDIPGRLYDKKRGTKQWKVHRPRARQSRGGPSRRQLIPSQGCGIRPRTTNRRCTDGT